MNSLLKRSFLALIAIGALAIIFGALTIASPFGTAVAFVMMWGVYALIEGVTVLVDTFRAKDAPGRGLGFFLGGLGVVAGLVALFHPVASISTFTWIIGFWLAVRGVLELVAAFKGAGSRSRLLLTLSGVLWFAGGILFMANPGVGVLTIATWLGVLAIIWGAALIGAAFFMRSEHRKLSAR